MVRRVLFIQGIYIHAGGSNVATTQAFRESLDREGVDVRYVEMFPSFKNELIRRFLTFTLTLPFCFLRGRLCVFEFLYKVSFYSLLRVLICRADICVFNHHSTYYLAPFMRFLGRRVIFIVHDSMYVKSRASLESQFALRFAYFFERFLFSFAHQILFVSEQEKLVCSDIYGLNDTRLVNIMSRSEIVSAHQIELSDDFCIIGDWRRRENIEGLNVFLASNFKVITGENKIVLLGVGSSALDIIAPPCVSIGGEYESLASLPFRNFIVPIWRGAGIKRKVLEMLFAGRTVYGTEMAFDGLPSSLSSDEIVRIMLLGENWRVEKRDPSCSGVPVSFSCSYFQKAVDLGVLVR